MNDEHGLNAYKHKGCHCATCRRAVADEAARRRKLSALRLLEPAVVDPTGTTRRLQGLMWLGYDASSLAARLGWQHNGVHRLLGNKGRPVLRVKAREVEQLYRRLSGTPARECRNQKYAVTLSRKRGYQPPSAWDEDEIDNPLATPQGVAYNRNVGRCQQGHVFNKYIVKSDGTKYGRCYTCRKAKRSRRKLAA